VNEFLGQHRGGRQVVAWGIQAGHNRSDAREVDWFRLVAIEARGQRRAAGEHHMMADRMHGVRVRERTHECPFVAARREHRQVLADLNAGRAGGDGRKLAANLVGCVGLGIEALMLGQPARKKDVDHGLDRGAAGAPFSAARRADPRRGWCRDEQPDRAGTDRRAARDGRMESDCMS